MLLTQGPAITQHHSTPNLPHSPTYHTPKRLNTSLDKLLYDCIQSVLLGATNQATLYHSWPQHAGILTMHSPRTIQRNCRFVPEAGQDTDCTHSCCKVALLTPGTYVLFHPHRATCTHRRKCSPPHTCKMQSNTQHHSVDCMHWSRPASTVCTRLSCTYGRHMQNGIHPKNPQDGMHQKSDQKGASQSLTPLNMQPVSQASCLAHNTT